MTVDESPPRNWVTAVTFLSILILFLVINLRMAGPYFLAVVMGGIFALLSFPMYQKLRARHWKPMMAATGVTFLFTFILIGPVSVFTIVAVNQAVDIAQKISEEESLSLQNISRKLSQLETVEMITGNRGALKKTIADAIQSGGKAATVMVVALLEGLPNRVLQVMLSILACFFLLMDGRRFLTWLNDKIPLDWDVRAKLYNSFKNTAISVIWATVAAAGAQALIMFFSFLVLRVPGAFLAGGATFIFAWIPILGSAPVWISGAIYLYAQDRMSACIIMLVLGLFTGIIDNYIRPLVLKGREELHPLVSLIAIFGGIGMFGILGVLIGPILAAVLLALLQTWPTVGRRFGLTFEPKMEIITKTQEPSSP